MSFSQSYKLSFLFIPYQTHRPHLEISFLSPPYPQISQKLSFFLFIFSSSPQNRHILHFQYHPS